VNEDEEGFFLSYQRISLLTRGVDPQVADAAFDCFREPFQRPGDSIRDADVATQPDVPPAGHGRYLEFQTSAELAS
jgi:hypothetical protein